MQRPLLTVNSISAAATDLPSYNFADEGAKYNVTEDHFCVRGAVPRQDKRVAKGHEILEHNTKANVIQNLG